MNSQMVAQAPKQSSASLAGGLMQRKCDKCKKKKKILQRSAIGLAPETVPHIGHEVLCFPGTPLDPSTSAFTEPRFGHDFGKISIHPKPQVNIQAKLTVNSPGDIYEQEADRVADQVMTTPAHTAVSGAPPRIQRYSSQATEGTISAPASVDRVLAGSGRPLEPTIQHDMEQRFGHDFSRVRVHSGAEAEQSALEVSANAYTIGSDIVFGAGRFAPGTNEGRRLIAHELTHVVQQSGAEAIRSDQDTEKRDLSPLLQCSSNLQRSPRNPAVLEPPEHPSTSHNPFVKAMQSDDTELYFGRGEVCPSCHQSEEQSNFPSRKVQHERVTESNMLEWAATYVWGEAIIGKRLSKRSLFNLLQRGEDANLDKIWESYRDQIIERILPNISEDLRHPTFLGSDAARTNWAVYVRLTWTKVTANLNQRAVDWLVRDIGVILHSRALLAGTTLVADKTRFKQIQERPEKGTVELGRWNATATVDFEWDGKRMVSVSESSLVFEVVGHEGIYFEISPNDFRKTDPFFGKVAGDVATGTKGIMIVGQFIKGLLNGLASPVLMGLDTSAKIIDMATQGISYVGKRWSWYDIGYTCISSTCQQYNACLDSNKSPEECKSDAISGALQEATIIIPLYRQGRECLEGDSEACGSIAALSLGLVGERMGRLSKREFEQAPAGTEKVEGPAIKGASKPSQMMTNAEFEEAAIRDAIGRSRPGDPPIARALEKPKAHEGTERQPRAKPEPPAKARKPAKETGPSKPSEPKHHEAKTEGELPSGKRRMGDEGRVVREYKGGGKLRRGADNRLRFCYNPCIDVENLKLPQEVIDQAITNYLSHFEQDFQAFSELVTASDELTTVQKLFRDLAEGGEIAEEASNFLKDASSLHGRKFSLKDLLEKYEAGDPVPSPLTFDVEMKLRSLEQEMEKELGKVEKGKPFKPTKREKLNEVEQLVFKEAKEVLGRDPSKIELENYSSDMGYSERINNLETGKSTLQNIQNVGGGAEHTKKSPSKKNIHQEGRSRKHQQEQRAKANLLGRR